MKFPRYWAKGTYTGRSRDGKEITIKAYGWSSTSVDEARQRGVVRARSVVERGIGSGKKNEYEYGNAPFREEVIESIDVDAEQVGIVSRNRYGALVLNASRVMFVDVDFPVENPPGLVESVLLAFSSRRRQERLTALHDAALKQIESWARANPSKSFRLYRTHSGFRILLTDGLYDPEGEETKVILNGLNADRLYRSLTQRQKCFRARLTPKPWRCKLPKPPSTFPWEDQNKEGAYRRWEKNYQEGIQAFSTCRLEKEFGQPAGIPEVARIIDYHDALGVNDAKPLA